MGWSLNKIATKASAALARLCFITLIAMFAIVPAYAHTVSYGILASNQPGTYTFYYGSYHTGVTLVEGSLDLTCGSAPKVTKPFTTLYNSLPAGLHTGANANYFFASGYTGDPLAPGYSATAPHAQGSVTGSVVVWESVTFTGIADLGQCTYAFNPAPQGAGISNNWNGGGLSPVGAISGGTFPVQLGVTIAKSSPTTSFPAAGTNIPYNYTVTNSGTVPLTEQVVVTDNKTTVTCLPMAPLSGTTPPINGLAVGASLTCTSTYTTTAADITALGVTNTASAKTGANFGGTTTATSSTTTSLTVPVTAPTVKVQKTTIGGFGGPFTFSATNLSGTPPAISTTVAGTATPGAPVAIAATVSGIGSPITITETPATGYAVTSASCLDSATAITGNSTGPIGTLSGSTLTIPGSAVKIAAVFSCTFTNAKLPTITLSKVSNGGVGAFTFTGDNGYRTETLTTSTTGTPVSGALQTLIGASIATTITETPKPGFATTGITCTGLGTGGTATANLATGSVKLDAAATAAGSNIACTFTNTALPAITISKISNGGVGTFTFNGDNGYTAQSITTATAGTAVTAPSVVLTSAGVATKIAETPAVGYTVTAINCTGLGTGGTATPNLATGSVVLDAAAVSTTASIACTFTNTLAPLPTVTITKVSTGGVAAFNFTGTNGYTAQTVTTVTAGAALAAPTLTLTAPLTATTITESIPAAYQLTNVNCTGLGAGGTFTPNLSTGAVAFDAAATARGAAIACTFTNAKLPTLTLNKASNGGVGTYNFTLTNADTNVQTNAVEGAAAITTATAGTAVPFDAGPTLAGQQAIRLVSITSPVVITEAQLAFYNLVAATACTDSAGTAVITQSLVNNGTTGGTMTLTPPAAGFAPGATLTCNFVNTKMVPILGLTKSAPVAALSFGTNSTYTLTVANTGNAPATTAQVIDQLPGGLNFVSASGTNWSCANASGTVTCNFSGGSIATGGGTSTISVVVTPKDAASATNVTNYASVDPTGGAAAPTPGPGCTPASACGSNTAPVAAHITPVTESGTGVSGTASIVLPAIASNDFVNGTPAQVSGAASNATVATSSTWPAGITLDTATGNVSISAAVQPGTYTVTYNLCDKSTPANCATIADTITVTANITPANDNGSAVSGTASTPIANIALNDTVNGAAAAITGASANATVAQSGTWPTGIALNTVTGAVTTTAAVQPGSYAVQYNLCDKNTPVNCKLATVTITVTASITPAIESGTAVSGTASTPIANVTTNDLVNGAAVVIGSNATIAQSGTWATGITLNTVTGAISTTAAVQPGTYSVTYQLCDKNSPVHCATIADTITITAYIAPVADSGTSTSGIAATPVTNVASNDFVNGVAAVIGASGNATVAQSGTWPTGISLNTATGAVSTTVAVLPGTYTAQYNLCDKSSPANCALQTVTITVNGNIAPAPESGTAVSGTASSPIANVALNDFVNGAAASIGFNATVAQSGTWSAGITLNTTTGAVSTTAAVQPGVYSVTYQLCDTSATPNCATTIDTVTVTASIIPVTESGTSVSGTASSPIANVAAGDTVNGVAAVIGTNATVAQSGTWAAGITLNTTTGAISTTAAIQPGSYNVTYQLCDTSSPANCANMVNTITVTASILPVTESGTSVSGSAATPIANVAVGDTVNGAAAVIDTNATVAQSSTWAAGITLNTTTGAISTTAAVQPGSYSVTYQLCDKNSPVNCATIADTITITASILPTNDNGTTTSGIAATPVANIASNDTVNGVAATLGSAGNATVAPLGSWPAGITLDPATGAVSTSTAVAPADYAVQYTLCDKNSPVNCAPATVTITVNGNIAPTPDSGSAVAGTPSSPITNVTANDQVNGFAATLGGAGNAIIAISGTWPAGITLTTGTGAISTDATVQPGVYTVIYQLCDKSPTPNCATTTADITVSGNIITVTESGSAVSGTASSPIASVSSNDLVNGVAATLGATGNATIAQSGTWAAGISLDTTTGAISTSAAVQPGVYSVTYQLCDKSSPANCANMADTITVSASILPVTESGSGVSGTPSTAIANVAAGDTVNGVAATLGASGNATVAQSGTWTSGITLDTATGAINIDSSVRPGSYSVTYQLCDKNSPVNCATIADTITVTAAILPANDTGTAVAGTTGTAVANVAANDTVNGSAALVTGSSPNATVTQVGTWPTGVTLNPATGAINTAASVQPGAYSVDYKLCDTNSPTNCANATATFTVSATILPVTESGTGVSGTASTVLIVITSNDTVNGSPVTLAGASSNANVSQIGTWPAGIVLNPANGNITITATVQPGVYTVTYQLCDKNSPVNCAPVDDIITVTANIAPINDAGSATSGTPATPIANVATGDKVNGFAATLGASGNATIAEAGTWPVGITLDSATGAVSTTAAVQPGVYAVQYALCDTNTPANCATATVTITVSAAILPTTESGSTSAGTPATAIANVASNDSVNGFVATFGTSGNATVAQLGTWPTRITLDTMTGAISTTAAVPPGTYTIIYQLCDTNSPANCANMTDVVTVVGDIQPATESGTAVSGTPATPIANIAANDVVNGSPAILGAGGNATAAQSGAWTAGITLDTNSGAVSTTAAVQPGSYTLQYQLCDTNTPVNCALQNLTVTVSASILPVSDNGTAVSGTASTAIVNAASNDNVNGFAATLGSGGNATLAQFSTTNAGVTLNTTTGAIKITATVEPGTHIVTYNLCDRNSPANCVSTTATVIVSANVIPVTESGTTVSGTPKTAIANIAANDQVNGVAATLGSAGNAIVSTSGIWPSGITLIPATGAVSTDASVQPGSYSFSYELCDKNSPANCATMADTITVSANIITALDTGSASAGTPSVAIANVLANDSVNGFAATLGATGNATITQSGAWPAGLSLDPATGAISTDAAALPGTYNLPYELCDKNTPSNCKIQNTIVTVGAAVFPSPDIVTVSAAGGTAIPNVTANDTVNGAPAVLGAGGNATVAEVGTWPAGITLDTVIGAVTVAPGTPPGVYTVTYQLCDTNTPVNCATSSVTITVTAAIVPVTDSGSAVSGTPTTAIANIASNDLVNGIAASLGAGGNATVAQSGVWSAGITLNTATGAISTNATVQPGSYTLTYQLCDVNSPVNCALMVDTITVTSNIAPMDDAGTALAGTPSVAIANVAANDNVNGFTAALGATGNATVAQNGTWPTGITLNPATGAISTIATVQPSVYTVQYALCDKNSPANCELATAIITITANILPVFENGTAISGTPSTPIADIVANDSVNGSAAVVLGASGTATVSQVGTWATGFTLNASTGAINMSDSVVPGVYPLTYQLCDRNSPANCTTTTDTITVSAAILPTTESGTGISGTPSIAITNIALNDTVNGAAALVVGGSPNASVAQSGTWPVGITLDPSTGNVSIAAIVQPGTYPITYQLCDKNTPANCATMIDTVTVTANIGPVADSGTATSGTASTAIANVATNDFVNGFAAVLGAIGNATVVQVSATNPGLSLDPTTGAVNVAASVQPGVYTLTYNLCDRNAPVNCATAIATVTVGADIMPTTDTGSATSGTASTAIANVAANDSVNGVAATLGAGGNATVSQLSTTDAGVTLDPVTGAINVTAAVQPGSYSVTYNLCDRSSPANCVSAIATVTIGASIQPVADNGTAVSGTPTTAIANIVTNDVVNGVAATLVASGNATVAVLGAWPVGFSLDPATGTINTTAAVQPGSYTVDYQLCDRSSPINCAPSTATIVVSGSILPVTDSGTATSGTASTAIANVATNDLVNGAPAVLGAAGNATIAETGIWPAGISLDPATGAIDTAATVQPGTYTVSYQLCDISTPVNCNTVAVTITVAAAIVPAPDMGSVAAGSAIIIITDVTANDTINGVAATLGASGNATIGQVSTTNAGITLDPLTGGVSITASVPPGSYVVTYQLCDRNTPVNCTNGTATIDVIPDVGAEPDSGTAVSGTPSIAIVNVGSNDDVNGSTGTFGSGGNATVSQISTTDAGVTLDPATGAIVVAASVQPGVYVVTYQICDRNTPANCSDGDATVTVTASIQPATDTGAAVSGTPSIATANVAANDIVNGFAATFGAAGNATVAQSGTWPAGISLDPATGAVNTSAAVQPGSYTVSYQLCDRNTPANCTTSTVTITVVAAITPATDSGNAVSGAPSTPVANVAANDTVNGAPATLGAAGNATVAESGTWPAGITLDPDTGAISTTAALQPGTYTVSYQLCDRNTPVNCTTSTVTITVGAAILPATDSGNAISGAPSMPVANVAANDTVNGFAATLGTAGNATVAKSGTWPAGIALDPATGAVNTTASVQPGTYTVSYQLCDRSTPANCTTSSVKITVGAAILPATDGGNAVSGAASSPVANVAANDTVNGVAATLGASGNASVATSGTWPVGITLDPATGAISTTAALQPGTYTVSYQLCDRSTPANCTTSTVTITVVAAITPATDTGNAVSGAPSSPVANVAANDTVNGVPAKLGTAGNATVAQSGTWPADITLDPTTGAISTTAALQPGTYTVSYQLCDRSTPANCTTSTVTITVGAAILAGVDTGSATAGVNATPISNVAANDTVNGAPATLGTGSNATIAPFGTWPAGITLDPTTGAIQTSTNLAPGTYTVTYQLCDRNTPANCSTQSVTITVGAAVLPLNDTGSASAAGGIAVASVTVNDTVNGTPVVLGATGNASITQGGTWPTGIALDPATGAVRIATGTAPGVYTVSYQLCDRNTPENCQTASLQVTVIDTINISGSAWLAGPGGTRSSYNPASDTPLPGFVAVVIDYSNPSAPVVLGASRVAADGSYAISGIAAPANAATANYRVVFYDATAAQSLTPIAGTPNFDPSSIDPARLPALPTPANNNLPNGGAVPNSHALTLPASALIPGTRTPRIDLPLDPSGVVYDANTGAAVPNPTVIFCRIDGAALTDADIVGGASYAPVAGRANCRQRTFAGNSGAYFIFFNTPGSYSIAFAGAGSNYVASTAPAGTSPAIPAQTTPLNAVAGNPLCVPTSLTNACAVQPQVGPPTSLSDPVATRYFHTVTVLSGALDVINNHLPVDAAAGSNLVITKIADRTTAEMGDVVKYTITVKLATGGTQPNVRVEDTLPRGFTYVANTAAVSINGAAPVLKSDAVLGVTTDGPNKTFNLGTLQTGDLAQLTYRVRIGVGSQDGDGINRAYALYGNRRSAIAQAKVKVTGGVFWREGCIVGRVYVDVNGNGIHDEGEPGVPSVRLYMEDGTFFITDSEGKYSYCGLKPITHVIGVDTTSLPKGSVLALTSNRNVGDPKSLFVDIKFGELFRADFALKPLDKDGKDIILPAVEQRRKDNDVQGEVRGLVPPEKDEPAPPQASKGDRK
jgi:large repetitive protein